MSTWWLAARRADLGLAAKDLPWQPLAITNKAWYFLYRFLAVNRARRMEILAERKPFIASNLANDWGRCITQSDMSSWLQVGMFDGSAVVANGVVHLTQAGPLMDTCELTPLPGTPIAGWLLAIGQELFTTPSGIVITGEPRKGNRMTVNLTKAGEKADLVDLAKQHGNDTLTKIRACLGWDARRGAGAEYDLDASIFGLDAAGKTAGKEWFVYFNNLKSPNGAIEHQGDELTGGKEGDDEQIVIDLSALPAEVTDLRIAVTIFEAALRGNQSFSQVENAFVRIVDESTGTELARYDLSEDVPAGTNAFVFAKVYRHNGGWEFKVLAEPHTNELNGLVETYKV